MAVISGTLSSTSCFDPYLYSNNEIYQEYALKKLASFVDSHWHEIVEHNEVLEKFVIILTSNNNISSHNSVDNRSKLDEKSDSHLIKSQLASYILSKCFYFLGDYQVSVEYAMLAGDNFFLNTDPYFELTIATTAIDIFINKYEIPTSIVEPHRQFVMKIIHNSFTAQYESIQDQSASSSLFLLHHQSANKSLFNMDIIGFIIESKMSNFLIEILNSFLHHDHNESDEGQLKDSKTIKDHKILIEIIRYLHDALITHYSSSKSTINLWFNLILDYLLKNPGLLRQHFPLHILISIILNLGDPKKFVQLVLNINSFDEQLQICLDTYDNAHPALLHVLAKKMCDKDFSEKFAPENAYLLQKALSGNVHRLLRSKFYRNEAFKEVLSNIKRIKDLARNVTLQNAVVILNGMLNFASGHDRFMRENTNWLSKFVCWMCFNASGSLGQIHHTTKTSDSLQTVQSRLPKAALSNLPDIVTPSSQQHQSSSNNNNNNNANSNVNNTNNKREIKSNVFTQSGAFFALGLMLYSRNNPKINAFLQDQMDSNANSEPLMYGLSAALGLNTAFTYNLDIIERLKANLFADQTLVGMSSAISIGLVAAGYGFLHYNADINNNNNHGDNAFYDEFNELKEFSLQTKHEKIMLGCGLGQALMVCLDTPSDPMHDSGHIMSLHENSTIIASLHHIEPYIRLSAINCLAMAYAGTNNEHVVAILLKVISDDVMNMVKRGALIALGFVLIGHTNSALELIEPFFTHHNPYLRYGAALAFGICFASSGNDRVLSILMSFSDDTSFFVNQAIFIASALIANSHNSKTCGQYENVQKHIVSTSELSHEPHAAKFGAILALGILNAGGQNVNISPFTNYGTLSVRKLSGLLLFSHYWFWYPLIQYICLAFDSSDLFLLNQKFDLLDLELQSKASLSSSSSVSASASSSPSAAAALLSNQAFDYQNMISEDEVSVKNRIHYAVLSLVNGGKTSSSSSVRAKKLSKRKDRAVTITTKKGKKSNKTNNDKQEEDDNKNNDDDKNNNNNNSEKNSKNLLKSSKTKTTLINKNDDNNTTNIINDDKDKANNSDDIGVSEKNANTSDSLTTKMSPSQSKKSKSSSNNSSLLDEDDGDNYNVVDKQLSETSQKSKNTDIKSSSSLKNVKQKSKVITRNRIKTRASSKADEDLINVESKDISDSETTKDNLMEITNQENSDGKTIHSEDDTRKEGEKNDINSTNIKDNRAIIKNGKRVLPALRNCIELKREYEFENGLKSFDYHNLKLNRSLKFGGLIICSDNNTYNTNSDDRIQSIPILYNALDDEDDEEKLLKNSVALIDNNDNGNNEDNIDTKDASTTNNIPESFEFYSDLLE